MLSEFRPPNSDYSQDTKINHFLQEATTIRGTALENRLDRSMVTRNALAVEAGLLCRQKDLHLGKVKIYLLKIFYNKTVGQYFEII
jgi:hypothetical protein